MSKQKINLSFHVKESKDIQSMPPEKLVGMIYNTVNNLNRLIEVAAKRHNFTVQWDIVKLQEMQMFAPYPHLDMRVLTMVKY